jgi:hypothetical protein
MALARRRHEPPGVAAGDPSCHQLKLTSANRLRHLDGLRQRPEPFTAARACAVGKRCGVTQDRMALATSVACESSIGSHHEPGDVLHDARDEQAAADETKDPQHRLVSTRLQSLSEVGVPRLQPSPTGDMAQEE